MKKRRAIFGVVLPLLALSLSACNFNPANIFNRGNSSQQSSSRRIRSGSKSSSRSSGYPSGHVHKYSDEWSSNSQYHWHDSTCGHDVRSNLEPHNIRSEVIKEATCQETGQRIDYCTICGYEANVVVPRTDHTWSVYESKEATCEEFGYVKKFCSVCGTFSTEETLPTGHAFDERYIQDPTCTAEGIIERRCVYCGLTERVFISPYGHDYVPMYSTGSTCSQGGSVTMQCTRCGDVIEKSLPPSAHVWSGDVTSVVPSNGIPYFTDKCVYCGAKKIALATTSGTLNGNLKSSVATDAGYIKLGSNGSSLTIDFEYPQSAYVRIYQHATYDNWRSEVYHNVTYHHISSANDPSETDYNFAMTVNGALVDLSEAATIQYSTFFTDSSAIDVPEFTNNGFSPVADCLVGDAQLVSGMNTITYTRLGSFCLNIDYFVLVITDDGSHQHSVGSEIHCDENYHWRKCLDPNCPISGGIVNRSEHDFYQVETHPTSENCDDPAEVIYRCSVCGFQKSVFEVSGHVYNYDAITYATNSNGYQLEVNHCVKCGKKVESIQFSSGLVSEGSYESGKLKQGTTISWEFPVLQTGLVSLYFPIYATSTSQLDAYFDPSLYSISFNGAPVDVLVPYSTHRDIGIELYNTKFIKFATYEITESDVWRGEVKVTLSYNVSNYRLTFDGEVRLEY